PSLEALANLKTPFKPDGRVTAGNSSQITDGASALVITTPDKAEQLGLKPRARFHAFALAASDPVIMLTAPIPATQKILKRANLSMDDIDVVEINEAFASVLVAWQRELGLDPEEVAEVTENARVNPNGGAIALGVAVTVQLPSGTSTSSLVVRALVGLVIGVVLIVVVRRMLAALGAAPPPPPPKVDARPADVVYVCTLCGTRLRLEVAATGKA